MNGKKRSTTIPNRDSDAGSEIKKTIDIQTKSTA